MSTHALRTSEPAPRAAGESAAARIARWIDVAVLALALPVFVAASLPIHAWAACAAAWLAQRAIRTALFRRAAASGSPRTAVSLLGASLIGRVWVIALAVLAVGLADRDAGLPAAILAAVLFQAYFTAQMVARAVEPGRRA